MALLIFWWMLAIWAVLIAAYFGIQYWRAHKQKHAALAHDTPVAHTMRLINLPEYKVAFKRYRLLTQISTAVVSLGLLSAIIITARPAIIANLSPVQKNRDIMLCLDASGSVLKTDAAIINRFSALVNSFQDQRFGLTLFNSSAVSIIPLNDNYQLISQQLKTTGQAFQAQKGELFTRLTNGTLVGFNSGTSLASDGLTSCIQHLGGNSQNRSQSIILATDNEVNGKAVIGMTQAIALAKERNVRVHVVDPGVSESKLADYHSQLKLVSAQTGGEYLMLRDTNTVNPLVDAVARQSPEKFAGLPQPAIVDNPQPFLYIAMFCTLAYLVLVWRLEL